MSALVRLTLLLLAAATIVQPGTGSLVVTVTTSDGGRFPGVRIDVSGVGEPRTGTTNNQGQTRIDKLSPGQYRVTGKVPNYMRATENVTVAADQESKSTLVLRSVDGWRPTGPVAGPDPLEPAVSREIYEAVLHRKFGGTLPSRLVVEAESLALPVYDLEDVKELLGEPALAMYGTLDKTDSERRFLLHAGSFPPSTRFLTRAEHALVKLDPDGKREFASRYGTDSFQSFSRVFVTPGRQHALVYYEHLCGNLCGEGWLFWLRRASSSSGPWRIEQAKNLWVS